jgi:deoxyribodipyrimidine photo-lyase
MKIQDYPAGIKTTKGGYSTAKHKLENFITYKLAHYDVDRNKPSLDATSGLSPYLHFGQMSPVYIAKQILLADYSYDVKAVFLEELVVRRELSMNFCWYNPNYDSFAGLPDWAKNTLIDHAGDHRDVTYSYEQLENADTHDIYWNAAQQEMLVSGTMHNYMRMYWGKKILEWVPDPINAFEFALYLNNKYELDGRDPNSYAGIAWCFGKHDRPWATRAIFGTVRSMTASGLERKFDMKAYLMKNAY